MQLRPPQKRGPPPLLSRRGGRLPSWTAVTDRPIILLQLPTVSTYRNMLIARQTLIAPLNLLSVRIAPSAR